MRKPQITHKNQDFLLHIVQRLCGGPATFIVGGLTAWWLVPIAYIQRGHSAVGGEWMAVIAVAYVAF